MSKEDELDAIRRRALASVTVDYRQWMVYGERRDLWSARNAAWILSGRQGTRARYRAPESPVSPA